MEYNGNSIAKGIKPERIYMKTVDMHCDTISALLAKKRAGEVVSLKDCDCHINLKKLKQGDYLLQNFADRKSVV